MERLTFEERAKLGKEILAKQKPVTLEEAKAQVQKLKTLSKLMWKKLPTLNRKDDSSNLSGST